MSSYLLDTTLAFLLAETNGDLDEALLLAQQAVAKVPGQPNFLDTLGYVYLKMKMPDNALQIFRNLMNKHSGNATIRYHFGMSLLMKGHPAEARRELEMALTERPTEATKTKIRELLAPNGH